MYPNWVFWIMTLLLEAIAAYFCGGRLLRLPERQQTKVLLLLGGAVLLAAAITLSGWTLRGVWAHATFVSLAYLSALSFCTLCFRKEGAVGKRILWKCVGFFFAVIMLGTLIRSWWFNDDIDSQSPLTANVVLRRSSGGFAGIDWEGVALVYQPRWLPFAERTLYRIHMGDTGNCDVHCAHVDIDRAQNKFVVSYGDREPYYIFAKVDLP